MLLAIAAGGAAGSVLRYWMSNVVYLQMGKGFPYGTLAVNVLGCGLMGVLYVLMADKWQVTAEWRALWLVGVLGGFTTFSAFSIETVALLEQGAAVKAAMNILLSVTLCITATWLGVSLARQM